VCVCVCVCFLRGLFELLLFIVFGVMDVVMLLLLLLHLPSSDTSSAINKRVGI